MNVVPFILVKVVNILTLAKTLSVAFSYIKHFIPAKTISSYRNVIILLLYYHYYSALKVTVELSSMMHTYCINIIYSANTSDISGTLTETLQLISFCQLTAQILTAVLLLLTYKLTLWK